MSEHAAPAMKPADDPAFTLPASLAGLSVPLCAGGLVALLVGFAIGTFSIGAGFGLSAYLTAFMYCLSIALGSLFFVLIQHLVRAGWSVVVRRVAELMMIMVIPLAILFLPVLFSLWGEGTLYSWDNANYAEEHHIPTAIWEAKSSYLSPGFFTFRACIYLAVWAGLAMFYYRKSSLQDETGEKTLTELMQARSGPAVILFCLATSFATFDWMMSLEPMWFSTMFGVYFFAGCVLSAHCAIAAGTFLLQRNGAIRDEVTVEHYHDLGKYIFGFVFFWTYISFSQFLLIWYANIPEEQTWFYDRQSGTFGKLALVLIFFHWLLPMAGTMSVHVRRRPKLVFFWAIYVLLIHYIDLYWIVMPSAGEGAGGFMGVLASILCVVGMAGLLVGLILMVAAKTKVMAVRDPRLPQSLAFENI
jgi:hypothetical protein